VVCGAEDQVRRTPGAEVFRHYTLLKDDMDAFLDAARKKLAARPQPKLQEKDR